MAIRRAAPTTATSAAKIGAKVVSHAKYVVFQLAEVAVSRQLFAGILERNARLGLTQASA